MTANGFKNIFLSEKASYNFFTNDSITIAFPAFPS